MNLLIVEDDPRMLDAIIVALEGILRDDEMTICRSRDSACAAIRSNAFDFALLDLQIPTVEEQLDAEVTHGQAVYAQLRSDSSGTPVCFLTAFGTEDFITDLLRLAERIDVWGEGTQVPMLSMLSKRRLGEIAPLIRSVKETVDKTDDIELIADTQLEQQEVRVLRIFGRRNRAASLVIDQLSGGLSGVQVLRLRVRDRHGSERLSVAARLGTIFEIKDELVRYDREVIRLPNGKYSSQTGEVFAGAGSFGGAFYSLIANFDTLASLLKANPGLAAEIVPKLENIERPWTENRPDSPHIVQDMRRNLVSDAEMNEIRGELTGVDWESFEQRRLQAKICCQHGDLHCGNVLVDSQREPVLIDYARVGEAAASLDPVTLELSPLFHPGSRLVSNAWPTVAQSERWANIDSFVEGCPIERFIRNARNWSNRIAGGRRELYSTAYALAVRQLKYADTDREVARAIIRSVIAAFRNT